MLSSCVVLPSLDSMKVNDVLLFLQEWKVYSSVTPKKDLVPARLLVDPFLLESLVLTRPRVDSSDEVFLNHLRSSTSFSSYEEFNLAMAELKVDVRKGDVRERMSCYLKCFLQTKSRASGLKLPDSAIIDKYSVDYDYQSKHLITLSDSTVTLRNSIIVLQRSYTNNLIISTRSKFLINNVTTTNVFELGSKFVLVDRIHSNLLIYSTNSEFKIDDSIVRKSGAQSGRQLINFGNFNFDFAYLEGSSTVVVNVGKILFKNIYMYITPASYTSSKHVLSIDLFFY
ncbi:hypothetical protein P9112_002436 [Eukaryota sp. TZLM1-RC]